MPLFIRKDHMIPLAKGAEYVEGIDSDNLTLLGWLTGDTAVTLYDDDGLTTSPVLEQGLTTIAAVVRGGTVTVQAEGKQVSAAKLILR